MLRQLLIPGTSLRVAEMTLGVMPWGTLASLDRALQLYDLYRAAGGNVFDTAHLYAAWEKTPEGHSGLGASERILGEVLRRRGDRRQVFILSKGGHPAFLPYYPRPERYLAPELVKKDLAESLERLGVETIDIYFLHRDDRRVPVGEIIDLLNEFVTAGRVRYLGASNWSPARIAEANACAKKKGVMGFVASQPEFSLAIPSAGQQTDDLGLRFLMGDDLAWYAHTQFPAFCYSATARGYFASKGQKAANFYGNAQSFGRLERAQELARKKGVTPTQIALAWIRAQPFPAMPIAGPTTLDHLRETIAALGTAGIRLTHQETAWLAG